MLRQTATSRLLLNYLYNCATLQHRNTDTAQVFLSPNQLEELLCLRCRYVIFIAAEVKNSFSHIINLPENVKSLIEGLASLLKIFATGSGARKQASIADSAEEDLNYYAVASQLNQFDNLQPPSSWVSSWATLFASASNLKDLQLWLQDQIGSSGEPSLNPFYNVNVGRMDQVSLQKQPDDQNGADSAEVEVAKGGKAKTLDETDQEKGKTGEAGAQQVSEEKAEKAGELSITKLTNMVCVETVNAFHDITNNNKDSSTLLHLSQEAQALGIDFREAFTADGMKVLENKMATVMWKSFRKYSTQNSAVFVNMQAEDSKGRVLVKRPVPDTLQLPFAGPISQSQQVTKDGKGFFLCRIFGIPFYAPHQPSDVMLHDVMVPAWAVRNASKADQAFFVQASVMAYIPECISSPTLLDVELMFVGCDMDKDAVANPYSRVCSLSLTM